MKKPYVPPPVHVTIPNDESKHPSDQNNVTLCAPTEAGTTALFAAQREMDMTYLDPHNPAKYAERRRVIMASGGKETLCVECDKQASRLMSKMQPDAPRPQTHKSTPVCPICMVYGKLGQSLVVCEGFDSAAPGGARAHWPVGMEGVVRYEGQPRSDNYLHLALTHADTHDAKACLCIVGYKMQPVK